MTYQEIHLDICGDQQEIAVVRLSRGAKRNALSDALVLGLRNLFEQLPSTVRAAVLDGEGPHFCAGLDLSELKAVSYTHLDVYKRQVSMRRLRHCCDKRTTVAAILQHRSSAARPTSVRRPSLPVVGR